MLNYSLYISFKNVLLPGIHIGKSKRSYIVETVNEENIYLRGHPEAFRGEKITENGTLRIIPTVVVLDIIQGIKEGILDLNSLLADGSTGSRKWILEKIDSDHDSFILGYNTIFKICKYYIDNSEQDFKSFDCNSCHELLTRSGLYYSSTLVSRFLSSLITKPFVLLSGLAGSGKTKLAEAVALWLSDNPIEQICLTAVGADWTNRDPILGYANTLKDKSYIKPESGVLQLILRANQNLNKPYFLILDEMNMSHVERYFTDFLSAMESSKREIMLHEGVDLWNGVPGCIQLPKNLFIIGTVNIDETTYMFSPKVLDRANVIEFRVSSEDLSNFLRQPQGIDLSLLTGSGSAFAEDFVLQAQQIKKVEVDLKDSLMPFFYQLQDVGAEFGFRTAYEISRYYTVCRELTDLSKNEIIDSIIIQKLLPKLHGSRRKILPVLEVMASLCFVSNEGLTLAQIKIQKVAENDDVIYKLSLQKILRMYQRAMQDGFTSFSEA